MNKTLIFVSLVWKLNKNNSKPGLYVNVGIILKYFRSTGDGMSKSGIVWDWRAQWLRALDARADNPGLVSSKHIG